LKWTGSLLGFAALVFIFNPRLPFSPVAIAIFGHYPVHGWVCLGRNSIFGWLRKTLGTSIPPSCGCLTCRISPSGFGFINGVVDATDRAKLGRVRDWWSCMFLPDSKV
jgi:hypothetical protein